MTQDSSSGPSHVLTDAAIVYGANRWLRGVHDDPTWPYHGQYVPADDRRHFYEFLHLLLLFDAIVMDSSSVSKIGEEIREMFALINARSRGGRLVSYRQVAQTKELGGVVESTCELVAGLVQSGARDKNVLLNIPVPWAYHDAGHMDRPAFVVASARCGLDNVLLPLAIFAFRGIAYAGFAHAEHCSRQDGVATYVAAPGRLRALSSLLASEDMARIGYPAHAYGALVEELSLPKRGYNFSFLKSLPVVQTSGLGVEIGRRVPRDALRWILARRTEDDAVAVRERWQRQLSEEAGSTIVEAEFSQSVNNSNVGGDLIQIYIGRSVE